MHKNIQINLVVVNNNDAAFHTDLNPDLGTVAKVMGF